MELEWPKRVEPAASMASLRSGPAGPARAPHAPSHGDGGFLGETQGVWGEHAKSSEGKCGCIIGGAQGKMKMWGLV